MDERRDLVDREELRRQIEADANGRDDTPWRSGWCSGQRHAIGLLDAMPAVECPRGWTRDEVLAELDADPDAVCEWLSPDVNKWYPVNGHRIGQWHPEVRRYDVRVVRVAPEPEWVPWWEAEGRNPVAVDDTHGDWERPVAGVKKIGGEVEFYDANTAWWSTWPVRDDGQVAVRPKAAN